MTRVEVLPGNKAEFDSESREWHIGNSHVSSIVPEKVFLDCLDAAMERVKDPASSADLLTIINEWIHTRYQYYTALDTGNVSFMHVLLENLDDNPLFSDLWPECTYDIIRYHLSKNVGDKLKYLDYTYLDEHLSRVHSALDKLGSSAKKIVRDVYTSIMEAMISRMDVYLWYLQVQRLMGKYEQEQSEKETVS